MRSLYSFLKEDKEDVPKDTRKPFSWEQFEKDIKATIPNKDPKFRLEGRWKKFIREQAGFNVYAVDGDWVRSNLSVIFGHGGHGYVHEFIPLDEIWSATHHWKGCECAKHSDSQKASQEYWDSCVLHEITEFVEMEKGSGFWVSHNKALDAERVAGLIKNPSNDKGTMKK